MPAEITMDVASGTSSFRVWRCGIRHRGYTWQQEEGLWHPLGECERDCVTPRCRVTEASTATENAQIDWGNNLRGRVAVYAGDLINERNYPEWCPRTLELARLIRRRLNRARGQVETEP